MSKQLSKSVVDATKWSSMTEIGTRLIAPITNAILARLLTPDAFGVVATLMMVVSFAEIFTDAGFQKYLVQHEFSSQDELSISTNVAFWTNLIFSLVLWGVLSIFASPLASLVGSPGKGPAIVVMGLQIPLLAFSSIQMARFRREFDFKGLFVIRIIVSIVPLVITVPLALILRNYWALIAGTLARDLLSAVVMLIRSKWKPKLEFSLGRLKAMLSFSLWSMIENVSIWATSYVDTLIVGSYLSEYLLGTYKTTMTTANSYLNIITVSVVPVLFAALSRSQNNEKEFKGIFFKFQRMVAILVFPLGFGIFVFSDLVTSILLGSQWNHASKFLGLWSLISAIAIVFSYFNSEVFRSKGRPKLSVLTQLLHIIVLVPVVIWSCKQGFETLTVARSLVRFELILVSTTVLWFAFRISFLSVFRNVMPSLVSASFMMACGFVLRSLNTKVWWDIISILICMIVYAVSMLVIPSGRKQMMEIPVINKLLDVLFKSKLWRNSKKIS